MANHLPGPEPNPSPAASDAGASSPYGRILGAGRGTEWWVRGWRLFAKSPWIWIAITLTWIVIMAAVNQIPFAGPLAVTLFYPVLFAGVLLGARELDRGGQLRFDHLFACVNDRARPLLVLAAVLLAGWLAVWLLATSILVGIAGVGTLGSLLAGNDALLGLAALSALGIGAVVTLLLTALVSVPLIMAGWFAPPLVLFRGDDPVAALKTSLFAAVRNTGPFLVYGLIGLALMVAATIPFGLGWLVLMPVSAASLYAAYEDIFGT